MKFEVIIPNKIKKRILKLEKADRKRVFEKLDELSGNYELGKHLSSVNLWSLRAGDYRILYQVDKGRIRIFVFHFGDRKNVYDILKKLSR
jgi:mRNA interferase RelE/StbE